MVKKGQSSISPALAIYTLDESGEGSAFNDISNEDAARALPPGVLFVHCSNLNCLVAADGAGKLLMR